MSHGGPSMSRWHLKAEVMPPTFPAWFAVHLPTKHVWQVHLLWCKDWLKVGQSIVRTARSCAGLNSCLTSTVPSVCAVVMSWRLYTISGLCLATFILKPVFVLPETPSAFRSLYSIYHVIRSSQLWWVRICGTCPLRILIFFDFLILYQLDQ